MSDLSEILDAFYEDEIRQGKNIAINDIKSEVHAMKIRLNSTNTDYIAGYMSALSTLEGYLEILRNKYLED